jgi:uncharacterized membrane protein YfcA
MNNKSQIAFQYWSKWLLLFVVLWSICYFHFAPQPLQLLSRNWPFIFVGFLGAILGNISAVGGGIIFIPSMIFIFHLPPVIALKVALLSQCFGMTSGAIAWLQKIKIPTFIFWLTIPALLLGSSVSSLVIHPSAMLVKVFFGPVSIVLGMLTLFSVRSKNHLENPKLDLPLKGKVFLVITSFFGGLITGWVAIGEGELVSALLMLGYQFSSAFSIAVGVVLLAVNSIYLAIIHQFFLNGLPWDIACFTGFGCVFGARLAPFIGQKFQAKTLKYIFAAIAIGDGVLFVIQYFLSK